MRRDHGQCQAAVLLHLRLQFNIVVDKVGWFDVKLSDDDGPFSSTRCDVVLETAAGA